MIYFSLSSLSNFLVMHLMLCHHGELNTLNQGSGTFFAERAEKTQILKSNPRRAICIF